MMLLNVLVPALCFSITAAILTAHSKFLKLQNVDTKLGTTSDAHEYENIFTISACFVVCANTNWCIYVSYNRNRKSCHIHDINGTAISSEGWGIYFKVLDDEGHTDMDLKNGAIASQSSTLYGFSYYTGYWFEAKLALDGNTDGDFRSVTCASTDNSYSYWIMEFGMAGVVDIVDIYLRTDYIERNSNRTVMVAQTYDAAVNKAGIECGGYFGPLINKLPCLLTIQCPLPIFGKFLRISHEGDDVMEICEVDVFSP